MPGTRVVNRLRGVSDLILGVEKLVCHRVAQNVTGSMIQAKELPAAEQNITQGGDAGTCHFWG